MKRLALILPLIFLFSTNCENKPEPDVFLQIKGQTYNIDDLYASVSENSFVNMPAASKKSTVNNFIKEKLILLAAESENLLEKDAELQERYDSKKNETIIRIFHDRTILDSIITTEALQAMYDAKAEEVRASHILISTKQTEDRSAPRSDEEARTLAETIFTKLQGGAVFEDMADKYSDDKNAKGGDLGYFGRNRMVTEFENTVFNMNIGEISNPVKTQFGYHIIKLMDKRKNPKLRSFDQEKENLKRESINQYGNQLRQRYSERTNQIKARANIEVNTTSIDSIIAAYNRSDKKSSMRDFIDKYEQNLMLVKTTDNEYDKNWLVSQMKQFSYFNPNRFLTFPQEFGQFLEAVLINSVFYEQALNMKIDEDPEVVSTLADFKSKMLVREYENISIKDDIQVTDEEIADYYQKNKSEEFMSNPTFETREIYVNEKETAEKLLKRARAGEDFEALAAVNTERYKDKKGYLGFIHEKRYGAIGKTASMLEAGQLCSEPIKSGSGWSIIKVYDTKPAEPKELESVKNTIENTLKKEKTAKAKDKLLAELKRRFSVKIWWDTLNLEA